MIAEPYGSLDQREPNGHSTRSENNDDYAGISGGSRGSSCRDRRGGSRLQFHIDKAERFLCPRKTSVLRLVRGIFGLCCHGERPECRRRPDEALRCQQGARQVHLLARLAGPGPSLKQANPTGKRRRWGRRFYFCFAAADSRANTAGGKLHAAPRIGICPSPTHSEEDLRASKAGRH
jgi:hypothetical protein